MIHLKQRFAYGLLLVLGLWGCSSDYSIEKNRVREVLTEYGKANPETKIVITTPMGEIKLRLYEDTPLHRANFIRLVKNGHYDNAEFYRVVYGFAIQGGDLNKKLDYMIPAEFSPKHFHKKGALAMARFDENNPELQSSPTEFYIVQGERFSREELDGVAQEFNLKLTPEQVQTYTTLGGDASLDNRYTVFGEVTEGMEVIDKIANVKIYTDEKPLRKVPLTVKIIE